MNLLKMNSNKLVLLLLAMIPVLLGCNSSDGKKIGFNKTPIPTTSSGISAVEQVVAEIYIAMIDKDSTKLDKLCAQGLSYGHSSGLVQDKGEFIEDVVNGPFEFLTIEPENQTIQIVGNTAVVRHVFVSKALDNGENVDIRIGCLQAYQYNEHGDLQLILRQAFKI